MAKKKAARRAPVELSPEQKLLKHLHEMHEVDLHKDVVHPLLIQMGMQGIRYTHGTNERGKDFLYVTPPDEYGDEHFCAIAVKNSPITGNAASSSCMTSVLNQLEQCRTLESLNPLTNETELPSRAYLYTTHPIPDAVAGNAGYRLKSLLNNSCFIVGPETLISLIKKHLPALYSAHGSDFSTVSDRLAEYANKHHESSVFGTKRAKKLDELHVALSFNPQKGRLESLCEGKLAIAEVDSHPNPWVSLPVSIVEQLLALTESLHPTFRQINYLTIDGRSLQENNPIPLTLDGLRNHRRAISAESLSIQLHLAKICEHAVITAGDLPVTEKLDLLYRMATFFDRLPQQILDKCLVDPSVTSPKDYVTVAGLKQFCEIASAPAPQLAEWTENTCLVGQAGAGKTSLARAIARSAIRSGRKVMIFPCAKIRDPGSSLLDSMLAFVQDVASIDEQSAREYLQNCDCIIIDGLDEAASLRSRLWSDLADLGERNIRLDCECSAGVRFTVSSFDATKQHGRTWRLKRRLAKYDRELFRLAFDTDEANELVDEVARRSASEIPRIIVTCRDSVPLSLKENFAVLRVEPFSDAQMREFFRNWFGPDAETADRLIEWLNEDEHTKIRDVCRAPIMASILAGLMENESPLPETRTELYEKRLELLLERWSTVKNVRVKRRVSSRTRKHFLSLIALGVHVRNRRTFTFEDAKGVWESRYMHSYNDVSAADVIEELITLDDVIIREGEDFSFGHLSFQEHLAANAIVLSPSRRCLLESNLINPWWRQVIVFYCGLTSDGSDLIERMSQESGLVKGALLSDISDEARQTPPVIRSFIDDCFGEEDEECDLDWGDGIDDLYDEFEDDEDFLGD